MATFSINQVRHFYVANASTDIDAKGSKDKSSLRFIYTCPDGSKEGTDIINVKDILYVKKTSASEMKKNKFKSYTVTVNAAPTENEVYAIKLYFTNYAGGGDDNITVKYADAFKGVNKIGVDTVTVADKNTLAEALKKTLEKNLKDLVPLASVEVSNNIITISEVEQPYEAGVKPFAVMPVSVEIMPLSNDSTDWATISKPTYSDLAVNGKLIADMEWFYSGARGDMYRGFGHPYGVKTKLAANIASDYNTIDIHYAYVGPNEGAQKSEKTITFAGTSGSLKEVEDALAELGISGFGPDSTNTVFPASAE